MRRGVDSRPDRGAVYALTDDQLAQLLRYAKGMQSAAGGMVRVVQDIRRNRADQSGRR